MGSKRNQTRYVHPRDLLPVHRTKDISIISLDIAGGYYFQFGNRLPTFRIRKTLQRRYYPVTGGSNRLIRGQMDIAQTQSAQIQRLRGNGSQESINVVGPDQTLAAIGAIDVRGGQEDGRR